MADQVRIPQINYRFATKTSLYESISLNLELAGGFYRSCVVISRGQIYTIGGQMTKREVYKIESNKITKMRIRLPTDFYLHTCATVGDRVWSMSPGSFVLGHKN